MVSTPAEVAPYTISQVAPFLTVKAIGAKSDGSPNSAVVKTLFQFVTGNPNINGNNAAQFTISDITVDAHLYYTLDGTDPWPTNGVDLGTVETPTNVWNVGFPISTNTLFKVRAFRDNYQPSAIVSNWFSPQDFVANKISFGFASGEASSDFVGSPGQYLLCAGDAEPLVGSNDLQPPVQFDGHQSGVPNPGPPSPQGPTTSNPCWKSRTSRIRATSSGFPRPCSSPAWPTRYPSPPPGIILWPPYNDGWFSAPHFHRQQPQPARRGLARALRQDQPLRHQGPDLD